MNLRPFAIAPIKYNPRGFQTIVNMNFSNCTLYRSHSGTFSSRGIERTRINAKWQDFTLPTSFARRAKRGIHIIPCLKQDRIIIRAFWHEDADKWIVLCSGLFSFR
jgi:hypothetical protein